LNTILIVGVGHIGFRHFQSLNNTKKKLKVLIFDKNYNLFNSLVKNKNFIFNKKIKLIKLKKLEFNNKEVIDVCIVSTNSKERYFLTKKILNYKIKNIIFEKVVFQRIVYFKKILALGKKKVVKMYVNCPKRTMKIFKNIKQYKNKNFDKINLKFEGSNWGICSNSIHFLDLFHFLANKKINFNIEDKLLDKAYLSKRKKYFELKGQIKFFYKDYKILLVDNQKYKKSVLEINLDNNKKVFRLTSSKKNRVLEIISSKKLTNKIINIPLQSEMTLIQVNKLIKENKCDLINLEDSFFHHKIILKFFKKKFEKIFNKKLNNCPIT
jgi:hypothetical protein